MAEVADTDIREKVRDRYAAAAKAAAGGQPSGCGTSQSSCCGTEVALTDKQGNQVFGRTLYDETTAGEAPAAAVEASLGCGVPTAVADLREGETVLDLGSGAGADVLISARRVGPDGQSDRARHDRRDARAGARVTPPRRASRTSSS